MRPPYGIRRIFSIGLPLARSSIDQLVEVPDLAHGGFYDSFDPDTADDAGDHRQVRVHLRRLGVIHVASVENGYLGDVFGRPSGEPLPWLDDGAEDNADMWAMPEETREYILGLYGRTRANSDATIAALSLDSIGEVPWWPKSHRQVTLHRILVHITTETHRHAGHADIIRELIDGAVGLRAEAPNLADGDTGWWAEYRGKVEAAAASIRS